MFLNDATDVWQIGVNALNPLKNELFMKQACRDAIVVYVFNHFTKLRQKPKEPSKINRTSEE